MASIGQEIYIDPMKKVMGNKNQPFVGVVSNGMNQPL